MLGKEIIVYWNNTAIASTKSNDIKVSVDLIPISTPLTADWKEYIADDKGWTVRTSFLVASASDIASLLLVGSTFTLTVGSTGQTASVKQGLAGTAILTDCQITATNENLLTGSFTFKGTGPLAQTST